jgi:hypothetical protein
VELVADANVLIDYAKTDPSILAIHVRHLGPIYVPSVILDEVDQLDVADCERLGLTVIEEPPEILLAAAPCPSRIASACCWRARIAGHASPTKNPCIGHASRRG